MEEKPSYHAYHSTLCSLSQMRVNLHDVIARLMRVPQADGLVEGVQALHDEVHQLVQFTMLCAKEDHPEFKPPSACDITAEQLAWSRCEGMYAASTVRPEGQEKACAAEEVADGAGCAAGESALQEEVAGSEDR